MNLEDALDEANETLEAVLREAYERGLSKKRTFDNAAVVILRCADEEWQRREMRHIGYLTLMDIHALPEGTALKITWNGGNGPGRYFLHREERWGVDGIYALTAWDMENLDAGAYYGRVLWSVGPPEDGKYFRDAVSLWEEG